MKKAVWISYDFGIKGDYTGLYTWLDNMGASECGHGLAFINIHTEAITSNELVPGLLPKVVHDSMKEYVKLSKTDRVYIIWRESESSLVKGEFINGNRRQAPWEGYGKLRKDRSIDSGE